MFYIKQITILLILSYLLKIVKTSTILTQNIADQTKRQICPCGPLMTPPCPCLLMANSAPICINCNSSDKKDKKKKNLQFEIKCSQDDDNDKKKKCKKNLIILPSDPYNPELLASNKSPFIRNEAFGSIPIFAPPPVINDAPPVPPFLNSPFGPPTFAPATCISSCMPNCAFDCIQKIFPNCPMSCMPSCFSTCLDDHQIIPIATFLSPLPTIPPLPPSQPLLYPPPLPPLTYSTPPLAPLHSPPPVICLEDRLCFPPLLQPTIPPWWPKIPSPLLPPPPLAPPPSQPLLPQVVVKRPFPYSIGSPEGAVRITLSICRSCDPVVSVIPSPLPTPPPLPLPPLPPDYPPFPPPQVLLIIFLNKYF